MDANDDPRNELLLSVPQRGELLNRHASIRRGVFLLGVNGVSIDAVTTAVMGYDSRATHGTKPFVYSENHLLQA
jgi:hypothetical protein